MTEQNYPTEWPQFYTATIRHWKPLLSDDMYKEIVVNSLKFLVNNDLIRLYAFVIMSNHIHLIWQIFGSQIYSNIRRRFMSFTAQEIVELLALNDPQQLEGMRVRKHDRDHQIWKREPLSVELFSRSVFLQKLNYIHQNPVRAGICKVPENYYYSSAGFYLNGNDPFKMLTHYDG